MTILDTFNTPPTLTQSITLILFIFTAGFTPVWVWWSKQYIERHPLIDWLNIITSASVVAAFVALPILRFLDIDGLYSLALFLCLAATLWRYMRPEIIDMNNLLRADSEIEFPEFKWVEEA